MNTHSDLNTSIYTESVTQTLEMLQELCSRVNREFLALLSWVIWYRIPTVTPFPCSYRCPWHCHCHDGQRSTHNEQNISPPHRAPSQAIYVRTTDHDNISGWESHRKEKHHRNQCNSCKREGRHHRYSHTPSLEGITHTSNYVWVSCSSHTSQSRHMSHSNHVTCHTQVTCHNQQSNDART